MGRHIGGSFKNFHFSLHFKVTHFYVAATSAVAATDTDTAAAAAACGMRRVRCRFVY